MPGINRPGGKNDPIIGKYRDPGFGLMRGVCLGGGAAAFVGAYALFVCRLSECSWVKTLGVGALSFALAVATLTASLLLYPAYRMNLARAKEEIKGSCRTIVYKTLGAAVIIHLAVFLNWLVKSLGK